MILEGIKIKKSERHKELSSIQLFLFTVDEYKRFADFFSVKKEHDLLDGYSKEDYIAIQTKLMILRKYGSKGEAVFLKSVLNLAEQTYPDYQTDFSYISSKFEKLQKDEMETFLADGTGNNLYKTIEDVMYGVYLHADVNRIQNLTQIDQMLLFTATRKYVETLETLVFDTYDILNAVTQDKIQRGNFKKAPVISVSNANNDVQSISGSPYWSNIYGKDASAEDTLEIVKANSLEDNLIILKCCEFVQEAEKQDYSVTELEKYVFPPTRNDWGDFSTLHEALINAKDVGWSTRVRYNDKHDMAFVQLMQNVQGAFTIDHPHVISQDICVISLVYEKRFGWKIFKIGDRAEYFKETISIKEAIKRVLAQFKENKKV